MAEKQHMLIGSSGPVDPQVGYVDGYVFGDRLLEGVRFKIELVTNAEGLKELVCKQTHPDDQSYLNDHGSQKRINEWYQQALEHAIENECQTEDGEDDLTWEEYWGPQ